MVVERRDRESSQAHFKQRGCRLAGSHDVRARIDTPWRDMSDDEKGGAEGVY